MKNGLSVDRVLNEFLPKKADILDFEPFDDELTILTNLIVYVTHKTYIYK